MVRLDIQQGLVVAIAIDGEVAEGDVRDLAGDVGAIGPPKPRRAGGRKNARLPVWVLLRRRPEDHLMEVVAGFECATAHARQIIAEEGGIGWILEGRRQDPGCPKHVGGRCAVDQWKIDRAACGRQGVNRGLNCVSVVGDAVTTGTESGIGHVDKNTLTFWVSIQVDCRKRAVMSVDELQVLSECTQFQLVLSGSQ
jgi:hypothetical protein